MRRRTGSMLLEVTLAVLLLSVAFVAVAQLLAVAARQRHETRWRAIATREVANVTERVMALPFSETTTELLTDVSMHDSTEALLPDATLEVVVIDATEPRPAKRIRISLAYRNTAGLMVDPIRLVVWKFATGEAE